MTAMISGCAVGAAFPEETKDEPASIQQAANARRPCDGVRTVPGDFNNDHITDVAVIHGFAGSGGTFTIDVLISDGHGHFTPSRWMSKPQGFTPGTFVAGDFDNDGWTDIAFAWNDWGYVSIDVYLNTGGSFTQTRWVTQDGGFIPGSDSEFVAGDFDGNGRLDIAMPFNDGGSASINVYRNYGDYHLYNSAWGRGGGAYLGNSWLAGDFNGDRRPDLAYVFNDNNQSSVDMYTNTGSSFSQSRWATNLGAITDGQRWRAADFDGDHLPDLLHVWNDWGYVQMDVFSGATPGSSVTYYRGPATFPTFPHFAVGDFDNRSQADVALIFDADGALEADAYINKATNSFDGLHFHVARSFLQSSWLAYGSYPFSTIVPDYCMPLAASN